jgi:hypothetical protein
MDTKLIGVVCLAVWFGQTAASLLFQLIGPHLWTKVVEQSVWQASALLSLFVVAWILPKTIREDARDQSRGERT